MIDRRTLVDSLIEYTCGQRCMGQPGNRGGCCTLGDRDFIIGPMPDVDEFLARLAAKLGRPVAWAEVFIDYEEGRALFPGRSCWQDRATTRRCGSTRRRRGCRAGSTTRPAAAAA